MLISTYYNAELNCSINIDNSSRISFLLDDASIPMMGWKYTGTEIQSVQPVSSDTKVIIEGVVIPYQDHISFTGLLDNHGLVDIDFEKLEN